MINLKFPWSHTHSNVVNDSPRQKYASHEWIIYHQHSCFYSLLPAIGSVNAWFRPFGFNILKENARFLRFPNFPLIMICFQCFCASRKSGFLSKNQISISKPLFFAVQFSPWLTKDSWALRTGTCKFSQRQSTDTKAHSIRRPPEGIMFTYENAGYLKRTEHPPICGAVYGLNDNGSKTKSKLVHRDSTVKWPTREPFLYFSGLDKLQWFRFSNRALSD